MSDFLDRDHEWTREQLRELVNAKHAELDSLRTQLAESREAVRLLARSRHILVQINNAQAERRECDAADWFSRSVEAEHDIAVNEIASAAIARARGETK